MKLIDFSPARSQPIELFESVASSSVPLGDGSGETHVYCVYFEAGGSIGMHPAGYDQLFLVVQGAGWAACDDGQRVRLVQGQGAYFSKGEVHSKGSDEGMMAIMVQVEELETLVGH